MISRLPLAKTPKKLIENRRSFGGNDIEFSIYDTYQNAKSVELQASNPLYCGMITGKKVIHFDGLKPFDFVPNQSLVVPSLQMIQIDFPVAKEDNPTQCITVEIDRNKVQHIVGRINEAQPRMKDSGTWEYEDKDYVHFKNNNRFNQNLKQLIKCFTDAPPYRDLLIDLNASRLVVHMLQSEARTILLKAVETNAQNTTMQVLLNYIKKNLHRRIAIKELEKIAHMSKASLFRHFKNEMGVSPIEYINTERMKLAATMLKQGSSVTQTCYNTGFRSQAHFIETFKKQYVQTPSQYKKSLELQV